MNRLMLAATVLALTAADSCFAQSGTRSGAVSDQLGGIRRSAIGYGFTIDQIISRDRARDRVRVPNVGLPSVRQRFNSANRRPQRPFSNLNRRPTISPYLNLFREDLDGNSDLNYQTLVRPQLEQQRMNQQLQRQQQQLNVQLQTIAAQPRLNPQGSSTIIRTGVGGTFGYTSRFYPSRP